MRKNERKQKIIHLGVAKNKYRVYIVYRERVEKMTKSAIEMNKAIDNFVIRMNNEDSKPKKKSFEECTIDEYFDYLEAFCNFLDKE